jgi:hypothetical protein
MTYNFFLEQNTHDVSSKFLLFSRLDLTFGEVSQEEMDSRRDYQFPDCRNKN